MIAKQLLQKIVFDAYIWDSHHMRNFAALYYWHMLAKAELHLKECEAEVSIQLLYCSVHTSTRQAQSSINNASADYAYASNSDHGFNAYRTSPEMHAKDGFNALHCTCTAQKHS